MNDLTNIENVQEQKGAPNNFTGTVHIQFAATMPNDPVSVARVTFEKGARTFWHRHEKGQVLYFLEGTGRVQLRGEKTINARPGDVVEIPANTEHWHGAHPEEKELMRHLAITGGEITWLDPVSAEDYTAT